MPKFFTVDRAGQLQRGMVLNLKQYKDIKPAELQAHVDTTFPNGISPHGNTYFLTNTTLAKETNSAIELLFEYVRRSDFSDCPSRFQSIFAVESVDDAVEFDRKFGNGNSRIWEVEAKSFFRGNMNLLNFGNNTNLVYSYFAHMYWRGERGPIEVQEFWEILLVPPVRVIDEVKRPR
jgi:hypothetical protein